MHSTERVRTRVVADLPAPIAPAALPDIPGGEPNLMHKNDLAKPVRVEFTLWTHSEPTPTEPESVVIYCQGAEVGRRAWTQPLAESERFVDIEPRHFTEGSLKFHYVGYVYNGSELSSDELTLTVDKTAPVFGANNGRLQFPELGSADLTEDFLLTHGDRLQALVPIYEGVAPGDVLIFYWDIKLFENNEADRWVLTREDLGKPLQFAYQGEMIRERKYGVRFAQYSIEDRAGNTTGQVATPLDLTVVEPAPRVLPALEIPSLSAQPTVELELIGLNAALDVIIPQAAVIKPGEAFEVVWEYKDDFGRWIEAGVGEQKDFAVPVRNVVAMAGKEVQLYYRVLVGDEPLRSDVRNVKVLPIPLANMPTAQVNGRSGGDLKVQELTSNPLVTLGTWKHISVDQQVSLQADGVSANGPVTHHLLANHKLLDTEVVNGVGSQRDVSIPLSFVRSLSIGTVLAVTAKLSYDDGATWPPLPNFGKLSLTIR